MLNCPDTVASDERRFSKLKLIKIFNGSLATDSRRYVLGKLSNRSRRHCRCGDRRNFPGRRLSGSHLYWPKLAKAMSGADVPSVTVVIGCFLLVTQQSKFWQFDSFIDFSCKAHKTWLSAHRKQTQTLANFHHIQGIHTRSNTYETKLLATYYENNFPRSIMI